MTDKWLVTVTGRASDLDLLSKLFGSGDPKLEPDGRGFALVASEFAALGDAQKIDSRAREILLHMMALGRLRHATLQSLDVGGISKVSPSGKREQFMLVQGAIVGISGGWATLTVGGVAATPAPPPEREWLAKIANNASASLALEHFAEEKSWASLYKVWELIEHSAGGKVPPTWASKAEQGRFTMTANHPSASGRLARHSVMQGSPTAKAMSLEEGTEFISRLLKRWLGTL